MLLVAHEAVVGYKTTHGVHIERYGRNEHWVRVGCGLPDLDDHIGWVRAEIAALAGADSLTYYRMLREFAPWRNRRKLEYPGGTPWRAHRSATKELRDYRNRMPADDKL